MLNFEEFKQFISTFKEDLSEFLYGLEVVKEVHNVVLNEAIARRDEAIKLVQDLGEQSKEMLKLDNLSRDKYNELTQEVVSGNLPWYYFTSLKKMGLGVFIEGVSNVKQNFVEASSSTQNYLIPASENYLEMIKKFSNDLEIEISKIRDDSKKILSTEDPALAKNLLDQMIEKSKTIQKALTQIICTYDIMDVLIRDMDKELNSGTSTGMQDENVKNDSISLLTDLKKCTKTLSEGNLPAWLPLLAIEDKLL